MEPHIGSEQGGTRPVVVLQNDIGNRYAPTLIVATVTSRTEKKRYQPTHVLIAHNTAFEKPSVDFNIFSFNAHMCNLTSSTVPAWIASGFFICGYHS